MDFLIGSLYGIWSMFLVYLFFSTFFDVKKNWTFIRILLLLIITGIARNGISVHLIDTVFSLYNPIRPFLSLLNIFINTFLVTIPFHGKVKNKLLLLISVQFIGIFCETITHTFFTAYWKKGLPEIAANIQQLDIVNFSSSLTFLLLILIIRGIYRRKPLSKITSHMFILELIVPVLSIIPCIIFFRLDSTIFAFFVFLILIFNVTVLLVNHQKEQYYRKNQENELLKQYDRFRERHYQELERHQAEIRMMKHDMKNQLIAMDAYVKAETTEQAEEQIAGLINRFSDGEAYYFTENAGANGLLSLVYRKAQEKNYLCEFQVGIPKHIGISDGDLITILGNVLDNAIEACDHCESQPFIRLAITERGQALHLSCENSIDGKSLSLNTRKRNTKHHGLGMKAIRSIVDKYDGNMKHHFSNDRFNLELTLFF